MDDVVMVPVPSDLVERVQTYINLRVNSGGNADWTEDAVAELYGARDVLSRTLVRAIAQGAVDDEPLTVAQAAKAAGTSNREALGIVLELVERFRALGGPAFPLLVLEVP